jgi:hypothetical protein
MPWPVPIVEIAFNDSPYAVSPTWTDVSAQCRSFTSDRGRQDDWGSYDSSASVVLDNRDRRFDPFNTAGIYYGKLTPRRQIRIRATHNGSTYDVFRGFISGFTPSWSEAGKDSTVTLSCFDAMQLLGSVFLPQDWSRKYILSTSPRHYWPCDEPINPFASGTVLSDLGSVPLNLTTTALATNSSQLAEGLVNSSIQGTGGVSSATAYGSTLSATSFTVSMWATLDPDVTTNFGEVGNCFFSIGFSSATSKYVIYIDDYANSGLYYQYSTTGTFDGGAARMISFSFNVSTKAFALYLDGVAVGTSVISGASFYIPLGEQFNTGGGQIQQFIVWHSIVSQAVIQEVYKYSTAFLPETTSARVSRIIAETSFPSGLVSTPASPAGAVLKITDDAPAASSELQLTADSEGSPLFVAKNGTLTLYSRTQQFTQSRSVNTQETYGASGLAIGTDVQVEYDGDSMRNNIGIQMGDGAVVTSVDSTSQSSFGQANEVISTNLSGSANAKSLSDLLLLRGKSVYAKVSPVEVVLSSAANWATTLDLELHDKIVVNIQPPAGNLISQGLLVQHIHNEFAAGVWRTQLTGSARWAANAPTASVLSASSITSSSATLEGFVFANGGSTTAVFDYSTSSSFTTFTTVTAAQSPLTENGYITAAITGLSPVTTYYVRIRVTNSFGSSTSSSGSFTSAAGAPSATIGTANGGSSNGTTATVGGTVSWNGASTAVVVQYSTNSGFSSFTEVAATPSPVTAQSVSVSASLSGLTLGTTYFARIKATNSIGTTLSGSVSFTTSALPTVVLNATTNFNENRATVNATISANFASSAVTFEVSTNGGSTWSTPVTATGSPVTGQSVAVYANLTGLAIGAAHIVRVRATNASGTTTTQNSTGNFTTWSLRTFDLGFPNSGTRTGTIPTITPTGGSALTASIYNIMIFGGGGSSFGSGGGGGSFFQTSSRTVGGNGGLQVVVGAGGAYVSNGAASAINGNAGGSLGGGNISVAGGLFGSSDICIGVGGTSGNGNAGGSAQCAVDKGGNITGWARGGGGGSGAVGGAGDSFTLRGGNGGAGTLLSQGGVSRGGAGGGAGDASSGTNGTPGTYSDSYGGGGSHNGDFNGNAGMVYFQYYAPSNVFS